IPARRHQDALQLALSPRAAKERSSREGARDGALEHDAGMPPRLGLRQGGRRASREDLQAVIESGGGHIESLTGDSGCGVRRALRTEETSDRRSSHESAFATPPDPVNGPAILASQGDGI